MASAIGACAVPRYERYRFRVRRHTYDTPAGQNDAFGNRRLARKPSTSWRLWDRPEFARSRGPQIAYDTPLLFHEVIAGAIDRPIQGPAHRQVTQSWSSAVKDGHRRPWRGPGGQRRRARKS